MADPNKMIRTDGTKVTTPRQPSWKREFIGLGLAIKTDPLILMLFPMFFASNWFYTWRMHSALYTVFLDADTWNLRVQRLQRCYFQHQSTFFEQSHLLVIADYWVTVHWAYPWPEGCSSESTSLRGLGCSVCHGMGRPYLGLFLPEVSTLTDQRNQIYYNQHFVQEIYPRIYSSRSQ